ncbi:unnamed protein product [Schistosoma curassoni]|uniref:Uncharacterized protein n=1 Tax=Schistosoma curassoni TaxID=6186 RepID=A0A183L2P3_9TREM|nr:unnamed protein product [Schistosoma curassoni]
MSANELNRLRDLLLDIDQQLTRGLNQCIHDIDQQLTRGLNQCIHGRLLHLIWAIFITILLIMLILIYPADRLTSIIKCLFEILLGIILFTLIWGSLIGRTIEKSGLKNAKHSISTLSSRLDSSNDFTLIK